MTTPGMRVERFSLSDAARRARYDALFEQCPHAFIQQSTYWAEVLQTLGQDEPIFLLCADDGGDLAGLPLYLYRHPLGNVMNSVPQAGPLGGPFLRDGLSETVTADVYRALIDEAVRLAEAAQCLSLTFITNPFRSDVHFYERFLSPDLVLRNFTQAICVSTTVQDQRIVLPDYNRRSALSRNMKRAISTGFSVEFSDREEDLLTWYDLHAARHTEIGAVPLRLDLLRNLHAILGPRGKCALLLVRDKGAIASGCLYVHHRAFLDVFMLSMNSAYIESAPNFLNTAESLLWASRSGIETYNWQSSPSRASGVYRYKAQWGSTETPYAFVTRLFCGLQAIRELGKEQISAAYRGHYLVPFAALESGSAEAVFDKA